MKILIYNRHFFPSIGGTEISGQIMARELAALGHTVTVVTATPLPVEVAELDEGFKIVRSEQLATLLRLARTHEVLFSRGGLSLRAFLASLGSGVPFVAFHEADAAEGRVGSGLRRYATDAVKALVRRRVRLHVVVSDALYATLALPAEADWLKLYNPVSEKLWSVVPLGICARDIDALFVGRLVSDKGLAVLRDALLLFQQRDRLRVAIAGSSDDQSYWEGAFSEVVGEVTFVGPVGGDRLRNLYARTRIVVMPSTVMEGMGMVAAEALSNGTPICASDQPALREVVGEAGLFHAIGDADGLAEDINQLLDDPRFWTEKSDRARIQRESFSMKRYRENLQALLDKLGGVA